jgi:catalase (peroxidase I)
MLRSELYSSWVSGGPQIDFKGGRVDALSPNNPGVPEPQQSLAEHTAAFKRQGFSATDMIGLVACGHTLGGVQSKSFPNIVPASTITVGNSDGDALFDTTGSTAFDNKM